MAGGRKDGRLTLVPASAEPPNSGDGCDLLSDPISDPGSFSSSDDVPPDSIPKLPERSRKPRNARARLKPPSAPRKARKSAQDPQSAKQRTLFEFARSADSQTASPDPFFQIVLEIYNFFNRDKKIPQILTAIHQAGGNIRMAVALLGDRTYCTDGPIDFRAATVIAPPDDAARYFKT
jgi:hypothetical protein